MNETPDEKSPPQQSSSIRPLNWLWVSAFVSVVLLGLLLDQQFTPKHFHFLFKPLVIVGVACSLICLLFQKEKPKPGHPHQAGIALAMPGENLPLQMLAAGQFVAAIGFRVSAGGLAISGFIGFTLLLFFRSVYGVPKGTRSWLGSSCRICDAGFGAYDFGANHGGDKRPITHCYRCGANRDASIEEPLSLTAQAFLDGKISNHGGDVACVPTIGEPYPWREQIIILVKLFVIVAIGLPLLLTFSAGLDGPYASLRCFLIFVSIALFAIDFVVMTRKLRMPCPHCKTNVMDFAGNRHGPLKRGYALRKVNGHYVYLLIPRYCPFCGKNIDEPVENGEKAREGLLA